MQILIASAKIMTGEASKSFDFATEPHFKRCADENAVQLSRYSVDELQDILNVNRSIAAENRLRYQSFFDETQCVPAVFAYDGMVFRKLAPETFTDDDLRYANGHLLIGSFLYGLLRPVDMVHRYRLEGNVELPLNGGRNMFAYWQPLLTDWFIDRIKADDGILVNLASAEFKRLFDWKRVTKEVEVITPEFYVEKNGKPKNVTIYAKMCRGAMTRWILQERITGADELKSFEYEGFEYDSASGFWLLK